MLALVSTPDEVLVERARDGDRDAFGELVVRHQAMAFRVAYVLCRDAAEAEDAAQEGFAKAFGAIDRFRPGAPLRPWLLTIVANEARNRTRSAGRRRRLAERAALELAPAAADTPLADSELRAALTRLDDRDREVIWLRYFADLSEAETAAALGCRCGTVKSRTSRALDRLRAQLGEDAA